MNQVSTNLYQFDFEKISRNALNVKLWEKEWTIFEYNGVTVTITLDSINTKTSGVMYTVKTKMDGVTQTSWVTYYLGREDNNTDRVLTREVLSDLWLLERHKIRATAAYEHASDRDEEYVESQLDAAEELLDSEGITHEIIRQAFIDHVNNQANGEASAVHQVYEALEYTLLYDVMITWGLIRKEQDAQIPSSYFQRALEFAESRNGVDLEELEELIAELEYEDLELDLDDIA